MSIFVLKFIRIEFESLNIIKMCKIKISNVRQIGP